MIIDPTEAARRTTRRVGRGTRDSQPTRIVTAQRTYPTDPEDLWDAVTNPERLPRWFLPVEGDLTVGGRYQLIGNAGGWIERCDRPLGFAITWEMAGRISWVRVSLTPGDEGGTTLEVTHEAIADAEGEVFWAQFGPAAVGVGWDLALVALSVHVDTGETIDPEVGHTFTTTPTGVEFIEACARNWGASATTSGDEPDAAAQAAQRSIEFYTGTSAPGT